MKSQHLIPVAAAAIGFAIAWVAKPAPDSPASVPPKDPGGQTSKNHPRPRPDSGRNRPEPAAGRKPEEVRAGDFPLVAQAENGPKTRSEAKMLRLAEALGLTVEQQGDIIQAVEESKNTAPGQAAGIEDLTIRGRKVEERLREILTPEQFGKFQEIRERERDNRIELGAARALAQALSEIDLSPGPRDEARARLRQTEKEKIQAVPASATLLLRTSVLPTSANELTMDGVLSLAKLAEAPPAESPETGQQQFIQRQKQALEEKLRVFDGILSPAQMGQYQAILAEQKAALDRVPLAPMQKPAPPR